MQKLTNPKKYFLKADNTVEMYYDISKLRLECISKQMEPNLYMEWDKTLLATPAEWYYDRMEVNQFNIPKGGNAEYVSDNVYLGKKPRHLTILFLLTESWLGKYSKNPYNFTEQWESTTKIEKVTLTVNGVPVDGQELRTSTRHLDFLRSQLLRGDYLKRSTGISYSDFVGGSLAFDFDLTAKLSSAEGQSSNPQNQMAMVHGGHNRINVLFQQPPHKGITMLVIATIPSRMTINHE